MVTPRIPRLTQTGRPKTRQGDKALILENHGEMKHPESFTLKMRLKPTDQ